MLLVCNDLILSMDIEKEQLKQQKQNAEQVSQIQKLQVLLQTMNQNYTNGEPIQKYMKNFKEEEENKIKQGYQDEFGQIMSENQITSMNSLGQLDTEFQQQNQKIKSFNSTTHILSNLHLSLYPQTANNLDRLKSFEKSSPLHKINYSNGQSTYSSPNSPKKQLSILGSLMEEKANKKTPLIYGKLKSLKEQNIVSANKLNHIEQGTPETKCTTFYSINESKENQSYFSSHNNSPQIFSTSNPLFFEHVNYPKIQDNVMDEEINDKKSDQLIEQQINPIISSTGQSSQSRKNTNADLVNSERGIQLFSSKSISDNLANGTNIISKQQKIQVEQQIYQYPNIPKQQTTNDYVYSGSYTNPNSLQNSMNLTNQINGCNNASSNSQIQDFSTYYQTSQQSIQQQQQQLYYPQQNTLFGQFQKLPNQQYSYQSSSQTNIQNMNDAKVIPYYFNNTNNQMQSQYNSSNTSIYNNLYNKSSSQIVNNNSSSSININPIHSSSSIQQQQLQIFNSIPSNNKQIPFLSSALNSHQTTSQYASQQNSIQNTPQKIPQASSQSITQFNSIPSLNQSNITHIQNSNQSTQNQLKIIFGLPTSPTAQKTPSNNIPKSYISLFPAQQQTSKNNITQSQNQNNTGMVINSQIQQSSNPQQQQESQVGISLMCSGTNNTSNSTINQNSSTYNLAQTVMQHIQNSQNTGFINNNSNNYTKYFIPRNQGDQYNSASNSLQQQKSQQKNIEITLPSQAKPLNTQLAAKIYQNMNNLHNKVNIENQQKPVLQNPIHHITKIQKPSSNLNQIQTNSQQQSSLQLQQYYVNNSNLVSSTKNSSGVSSGYNSTNNRLTQPVLIQPSTNQRFQRQSQVNPSFQNPFIKTANNTQNSSLNNSFKNQSVNVSSTQKSNTCIPRSQFGVGTQRISQNSYFNN